ncbi:hypothetical protein EG327_000003 [Venturia inaequalis]|uniref:Uncharacterized protein n=1 Tax=Venturia inaequalis TaxID=5025 RepID=A0A8H3VTL4_VENIN|nr:hypothetical protein EG327_000003 [Venturia inaequalis]
MGGHAFCKPSVDIYGHLQPALYTPRLPPRVYEAMKKIAVEKLKGVFHHVVVAIEHPEKADHGDIDVLVCGFEDELSSKSTIFDFRGDIALQLGADESRSWCDGNQTGFFAVPVPTSIISLGSVSEPETELSMLGNSREYWVQVDIQVVTAPHRLQWHRFRLDHATLQPILSLGLRPAGFIFLNDGFYIRIPGTDRPFGENHPKTPLIFLTSDVSRLLQYLGLPLESYGQSFNSCETYWIWATSAQHFAREYLQPPLELKESSMSETNKSSNDKKVSAFTSGLAYYFSRRDSMRMFTDEWLPAHPHIGTGRPNVEEIFQEALTFFDARDRYHTLWSNYRNERMEVLFWDKVVAKLSEIKYTEMARQKMQKIELYEEISAIKGVTSTTCKLARALEMEKSRKNAVYQLEEQERKKIRKIVNAAVITMKRRVVFEARPGYGRYPVVKEQPINDGDHSRWVEVLIEGGLTEDELLDWISSHGFLLLENERDRTRPAREAKRAAKKETAERLKCSDAIKTDLVEITSCDGIEGCRPEDTGFKA